MKTFDEQFKDRIDMTDGSVVLRREEYQQIQKESLESVTVQAERIWKELYSEAMKCKRTWGMGFPVISTFLLRKYWKRATGYESPEG